VLHLNLISGHRDANATDCPGSALYAELPQLRRRVAALTAPLISVGLAAARNPVAAGQPAVLSGRVARAARTPLAAATVAIEQLRGRTFVAVASATTATDGSWSATVPLSGTATLRAHFAGDRDHRAAVSPSLVVRVRR